jgi:hypothetical protein
MRHSLLKWRRDSKAEQGCLYLSPLSRIRRFFAERSEARAVSFLQLRLAECQPFVAPFTRLFVLRLSGEMDEPSRANNAI